MNPLVIYSIENTKFVTKLWGIFFIFLGWILVAGTILLWLIEGFTVFSIIYMILIILFLSMSYVGFYYLSLSKYPIVLSCNQEGIHYFTYTKQLSLKKQECIISWKSVKSITSNYSDENSDTDRGEEPPTLKIRLETGELLTINLYYTKIFDTEVILDDMPNIVAKIHEMHKFYS